MIQNLFLDIVINYMILSEILRFFFYLEMLVNMYKLVYKIETTVFIKFNQKGAVNIYKNAYITIIASKLSTKL